MENSSLSDRPTSEEAAEVFPDSGSRREQSSHDHAPASRAANRTRPTGERTRVRSWMRAGALDWGIRIAVVGLVIGGFFAIYINGVNEGWWHAWGHTPRVATTGPTVAPTPAPTASSEPAMSGGYQIGPDGVLVRPAEYAAETYTKPELPEAAKEHTERGAEAAAEHYLALLVYAWNTGDTQPLADMSDANSDFANTYITNIDDLYNGGWSYGTSSRITDVHRVEPVPANGTDIPDNSILVKFHIVSIDGIKCQGVRTKDQTLEYGSTLSLIFTWREGKWVEIQGRVIRDE